MASRADGPGRQNRVDLARSYSAHALAPENTGTRFFSNQKTPGTRCVADMRDTAHFQIVPIEQQQIFTAPPAVKPRAISRRVKAACDALVVGKVKTVTDAAIIANLSREHLSRELSKPHIAEYLRQRVSRTLAMGAARASARLVELIDAGSEHVSLDATKHTLGIAGIKPASDAQVSVNIDIKAGYVIDLSEPDDRRLAPLNN